MSLTTKVNGAIHKLLTAADFADSDWAPSAAGEAASWAPGLKAYKVGNTVHVHLSGNPTGALTAGKSYWIANLPEGYRPINYFRFPTTNGKIEINPNTGAVEFTPAENLTTGAGVFFDVVFCVKEIGGGVLKPLYQKVQLLHRIVSYHKREGGYAVCL
ncbi:hypothetical protein [Faecalibaculum rodentium]|uniref:hypothetical protein n=1 Tax=Faecalibaculum rodentium TaxID=1702221 RepID=UPI00272FAEA1|nr:hypothetical protein [Faecalibaculum rodentium]